MFNLSNDQAFAFVELEWWAPQSGFALSGRQLLLDALRAAKHFIVPETVTVSDPAILEFVPEGNGETPLYFTVVLRHGGEAHELATAIRNAGIRVKGCQPLPTEIDGTDFESVWAFEKAEYQRCHAEYLAEYA